MQCHSFHLSSFRPLDSAYAYAVQWAAILTLHVQSQNPRRMQRVLCAFRLRSSVALASSVHMTASCRHSSPVVLFLQHAATSICLSSSLSASVTMQMHVNSNRTHFSDHPQHPSSRLCPMLTESSSTTKSFAVAFRVSFHFAIQICNPYLPSIPVYISRYC